MKKYILSLLLITLCTLPLLSIYADTQKPQTTISTYYPTEGTYSLSPFSAPDIILDDLFIYEKISGWYYIENLDAQLFKDLDVPPLFRFIHAGENTFYIKTKSDTYLTLSNSTESNDFHISLSPLSEEPGQKWTLHLLDFRYDEVSVIDGIYSICTADEHAYTIKIKDHSKLVDQPIHYDKTSKTNEPTYEIKQEPDGWYTIKSTSSNLFWEVFLMNDVFYLRQWAGTGGNNQKFKFVDAGNDTYHIVSKYHLSLDAYSQQTKQQISLTSYPNDTAQSFTLSLK